MATFGYPCFSFDYRGFGKSEGGRGRVLLQEQIRDIENAAIFVSSQPELKKSPIILIGWGMGAGLIIAAADETPRLGGLIAINGFYNGERVQQSVRGKKDWHNFLSWVYRKRTEEVRSGDVKKVYPFLLYPLDPVTKKYVDTVLRKNPEFGGKVELHFEYSLLHFYPEEHLDHLKNIPILIAHSENNKLHSPFEAKSLYKKYPGPKDIYWIKHAGHTEWVCDDCDPFKDLIDRIKKWLSQISKKKVAYD